LAQSPIGHKEIKMKNVISDRALDLGVFALDSELENGREGLLPVYHPPFKVSFSFSPRQIKARAGLKLQARNLFARFR
jgi:hypothetical protein